MFKIKILLYGNFKIFKIEKSISLGERCVKLILPKIFQEAELQN